MQNLNNEQKSLLLKNPNVKKISESHVFYTSHFKIDAVKQYQHGKSSNDIFRDAGINPDFFIKKYCLSCLKRWVKKFMDKGEESLKINETGKKSTGRPPKENLDELTYEELQAIVEIQREVINELKKKRALAKKK
jgi:transposase-like protein